MNELIYQNTKKYIALNIDKTKETLEQKIEKLKAEIKNVKISWEEGSDTLNWWV